MQIDATRADLYVEPEPFGMVLMAGKIAEFNSFLWKQIIEKTLQLSRDDADHSGNGDGGSRYRALGASGERWRSSRTRGILSMTDGWSSPSERTSL